MAEVRQPLLQGAGPQFNRIAGPGATPGEYNGVMVSRINTDIALTNFETGVRNLVSDVEIAYWELYFQYRSLDAVIAGRDSALRRGGKSTRFTPTAARAARRKRKPRPANNISSSAARPSSR